MVGVWRWVGGCWVQGWWGPGGSWMGGLDVVGSRG